MKNILLSLLSVFVLYVMLIFISPATASTLSSALGIEWLQNTIISFKENLDTTSTSGTGSFLSGALELSNQLIDGVDSTKEKIDSVRETLYQVEQWYDSIKSTYEDIVNVIDKVSEVVEVAETLSTDIQNLVATGATQ